MDDTQDSIDQLKDGIKKARLFLHNHYQELTESNIDSYIESLERLAKLMKTVSSFSDKHKTKEERKSKKDKPLGYAAKKYLGKESANGQQ